MTARGRATGVIVALVMAAANAAAQTDSVPVVRHILAIDYSRVRPFRRSYDMIVVSTDSARAIGRRDVSLQEAALSDSTPGWLLVESRTGVVASVDSILLSQDLRPVRWRSVLGAVSLDIAFSSDSLTGAIHSAHASVPLRAAIPPDLVASMSGMEMLASLLPLAPAWSDSANALSITFGGVSVLPTELLVAGDDSVTVSVGQSRPSWVLSMRSGSMESRVWVGRDGDVLRAQQLLPSHVGAVLEYRLRFQPATAP